VRGNALKEPWFELQPGLKKLKMIIYELKYNSFNFLIIKDNVFDPWPLNTKYLSSTN
jgi:hypothetical protein